MGKVRKNKYLFVSIKPEFAKKIINKEKCIELRTVKPNIKKGDYLIIYASSPLKCIVGFAQIKQVIVEKPCQMWLKYNKVLGIDKERFDDYYKNKDKAIGIELEAIRDTPHIPLSYMRNIYGNFHPPQVYRYITRDMVYEVLTYCCTLDR